VQSVLLLGSEQSGSAAAAVVVVVVIVRSLQFVIREQKIFQLLIQWIIQ
jgi:hypothetical protein